MMEPKILILIGSAREESNTKHVAGFLCGGMPHTTINLLDTIIEPYSYNAGYSAKDGFDAVIEQVLLHDIIVFATPVYWYSMSSVMKIFFDRLTDLLTIKKETGRKLKGKAALVIAIGSDPGLPEGFEVPFRNTAAYFDMEYKGAMYFIGGDALKPESKNTFAAMII